MLESTQLSLGGNTKPAQIEISSQISMPFTSLLLMAWARWDRPREYPASGGPLAPGRLAETWHHWQAAWLPRRLFPGHADPSVELSGPSPTGPAKPSECVEVAVWQGATDWASLFAQLRSTWSGTLARWPRGGWWG